MGGPSSPKILYPEWQHEFQAALLELDRKKLLERVTAAETVQAISPSQTAGHRRCPGKPPRSQAHAKPDAAA